MNELTQEQALGILIQGVRLAQKAGAFSIEDAETIAKAIRVFVPKQEQAAPETAAPTSAAPEPKKDAKKEKK